MTNEELISKLSGIEWEDFEVKEAKGELFNAVWETVSSLPTHTCRHGLMNILVIYTNNIVNNINGI